MRMTHDETFVLDFSLFPPFNDNSTVGQPPVVALDKEGRHRRLPLRTYLAITPMSNIGRSMAKTINPTIPPIVRISNGSKSEVMTLIACSTSFS